MDEVFGVDGAYARKVLLIPQSQFAEVDLTEPLDLGRSFDLVISLEVAEHLEASASETFVASLVAHGDLVLFSAACPKQGGPGHVTMRWPSYWSALFAHHGLVAADVLRDEIWDDDRIAWWYRQNIVLFGTESRLAQLGIEARPALDRAHPELVRQITQSPPTRVFVEAKARGLVRRIRRRFRALLA